ncbi:MAG: accessory gene regulator B family protein [Clostridia bacterium]|nr:accessory gene regulator B family protein [Clostridia bacterium]
MTDKFKFYLINRLQFSEVEAIKISYMLKLIYLDLSKLILLYLIFSHFGKGFFFILTTVLTILIRMAIGGHHMKTYLSCLVISLSYYSLIFYVSSFAFSTVSLTCFGVMSLLIFYWKAPVIPKQRQRLSYNKRKLKIQAIAIAITYIILYWLKPNNLTELGIWVITVQSMVLLLQEVFYVSKT